MKKCRLLFFLICLFNQNFSNAQFLHDIFFEVPDTIIHIDTSNVDNIWQIGKPSKIIFDIAYSIPNAIVTDTLSVPIYLRFIFSSDSFQNNKEGWMIDNIQYDGQIACEGINETQNDRLISIFPNPTQNYFTINNKSNSDVKSISIYDVTGKNIYERSVFSDEKIDIRPLNSGIYFLKLIERARSIIKRLVILK